MMASVIVSIAFMVLPRPVRGLGSLEVLKKLKFRRLKPGKIPVKHFLLRAFVRLGRGLMALKTANIHFWTQDRRLRAVLSSAVIILLITCPQDFF